MTLLDKVLLYYLLIVNTLAFLLYGIDKRRARRGRWRIPERTLLLSAGLGGCVGAFAGMQLFHHKTRKVRFAVFVPFFVVLWSVGLVYFRFYW